MTKMQLKESARCPGELLLLAVICQMLGSYHCYAKLIMPFTVIAFALPFTWGLKWIGKGASKSKFASRSQTSKPSSPANVKVTTSKKAVSPREAPKPRIDVVETVAIKNIAAKVETVPK